MANTPAFDNDEQATFAICPRCGNQKLRTDRPAMNALSRTDNQTYVCSDCGTAEALDDYFGTPLKQTDWVVS